MNEHDSERLAALLEADGLVPAESDDSADVVVSTLVVSGKMPTTSFMDI